jgi:hypothetical protein
MNRAKSKLPEKKQGAKSSCLSRPNKIFFVLGSVVTFGILSAQMILWETLFSHTVMNDSFSGTSLGYTAAITKSSTSSAVGQRKMNNLRGKFRNGMDKRMPSSLGLTNYATPQRTPANVLAASKSTEEATVNHSIFNCGHPSHGKCTYFYPKEFFRTASSSQEESKRSFQPLLDSLIYHKENYTLWLNMPFIGLWTTHFTPLWTNPVTKEPFKERRVTFFHVHKTGGTSIVTHLRALKRKTEIAMNERQIFMWENNKAPDQIRSPTRQRLASLAQQLKADVYPNAITYPNSTMTTSSGRASSRWTGIENGKSHVIFAIVRDPVERFISAIGQAMGAFGSRTPLSKVLQSSCVKSEVYTLEASRSTIQCVIDFVRTENGFYREVHFTPQALEIAFATGTAEGDSSSNVPVALFNYPELKLVLEDLGVPPSRKVRDGSNTEYRPAAVLKNMTAADYTDHLISQVCQLYEVDVVMMRSLGFPVPKCDGIV